MKPTYEEAVKIVESCPTKDSFIPKVSCKDAVSFFSLFSLVELQQFKNKWNVDCNWGNNPKKGKIQNLVDAIYPVWP